MLPITGYLPTSLVDFPGKIASIYFVAGCNLRCPFCHNSSLFEIKKESLISRETIIPEIKRRSKFIDGIVFSGGEPSLYDDLIDLMKEIRNETGLTIKLDSNGLRPEFIKKALPLISYIAIDIKTTPDKYAELGSPYPAAEVERLMKTTAELIEKSEVAAEYRTTMYPPIVESHERLYHLAEFVPAKANWFLQRFVSDHAYLPAAQASTSYSIEQLERMVTELRNETHRDKIFVRAYIH